MSDVCTFEFSRENIDINRYILQKLSNKLESLYRVIKGTH